MICVHEAKNMKVYSKNMKFLIPSNKKDSKHGSVIFLVTPNKDSSNAMMNIPYCINRRQFESYYVEKAVNRIITAESASISGEVVNEDKLETKDRNKLKDSTFGLPEERKYPLNDEAHVRDAIKKFNYVDETKEKELAKNILKAIDKFHIKDIKVGDNNRFRKYMKPVEEIKEATNFDIFGNKPSEFTLNEFGLISNRECIYIADDIINEADSQYNTRIKKMIYNDRMKTNKQILDIYGEVKTANPWIKYTYLTLERYKLRNLFFDTQYYVSMFRQNNTLKLDRGVNLFLDYLSRLTTDHRLANYNKKTIFIPVDGWVNTKEVDIIDYKQDINPISCIYRLLKTHRANHLADLWAGYDVLFIGKNGYFRMDMAAIENTHTVKFMTNINRLLSGSVIEDDEDVTKDSEDAIVTTIYNNIQNNTNIKFKRGLVGDVDDMDTPNRSEDEEEEDEAIAKEERGAYEDDEERLDAAIKTVSKTSDTVDDAVDKLADPGNESDQDMANIINDLSNQSSDAVDISPARAARINTLNDKFKEAKVKGVPVKDLLKDAESAKTEETLPETALPINSINDEWKHMSYMNFEKAYNVDADIANIIKFFGTRKYPVSVLTIDVEDTSNSEDLIETWTVKMEDAIGTRFNLVFDIPKFIPGTRFMKLRGNDKTINGQLMNIPIVKTDLDTCQITSNYNKIFITPYGSSAGKSNVIADRIMKTLGKLPESSKIKAEAGDNSRLAEVYDLPIDYVDLGANYSRIKFPAGEIVFNQEELISKYGDKIDKSLKGHCIIFGTLRTGKILVWNNRTVSQYNDKVVELYSSSTLAAAIRDVLTKYDKDFAEIYPTTNSGVRYKYSKASILNTKIPLIVVAAYSEGLTSVLKKAGVIFTIEDKNTKFDKDAFDRIKFKDGYISYLINYSSSLLMNGLKECNTEDYSITEIDNRSMWIDFLDIFGGRIKADGLDNFYDLMVDPITERVCPVYDLPTDYIEQLIYANNLLADSKFNRHTDLSGNRFRTNELVAAHAYKCLAKSYSDYRIKLKKTGKASMTIKRSAIIDSILSDNTTSDLSTNTDLSYVETAATVSFKGLSGMNSERSYGLDKRTYDDSMLNNLAMSTGFAGNVGVNRQTTINMNVDSSRGYIKTGKDAQDNMNVTNSLCISEAIMPMISTKDDPFRLSMGFIQNSKHTVLSEAGDPCLVTTGADDAIPYLAPDVFNYKAKQAGKVLKKTDEYIILQYKDGSTEVVELTPQTYKNSDGGFFLSLKLDCDLKEGQTFKENNIVAYNKKMYTRDFGYDDNPTMNRGTLAKVAMLITDEGYEDSGINSDYCAKAMARKVTVCVDVVLNKQSSIYNVVKVGDHVEEGQNLLVFQNAFDDEDANALMKSLVNDTDEINELGRIPKKAKVTGDIVDIHVLRTCELNEMSPTLKKFVSEYEKKINDKKKLMEKYDPEKAKTVRSNYKLENTGKLKNVEDGVLIEFYIEYISDFGSGEKMVVNAGNKCVSSGIIPKGKEPYSTYRPNEKIDLVTSINSNNGRMILSNIYIGMISKGLIELDRQVKEIMGVATKDCYDIHEYLHPEITKLQREEDESKK